METSSEARERLLLEMDDELLKGGVVISEWCSFIVREADNAFVAGAHLPTLLTAVAGIETYLRSEHELGDRAGLYRLIEDHAFTADLKSRVHELRKQRNKWVHVNDPWNDLPLIHEPETFVEELEEMAEVAIRALREVLYENQWI